MYLPSTVPQVCSARARSGRPAKSGVLAAHRGRRYSLRVRLRALVVLALCVLLPAGCAGTQQPKITVLPANQVMITRVIPAGVASRHSGCAVKTLNKMPGTGFRELGTIRLAGAVPSAADVTTLLDEQACALGADAVFIEQMQEQSAGDKVEYEITAAAIGFSPKGKAGPSKTITPHDSGVKSGEGLAGQPRSEDIVVPETTATTAPSLEARVIPMQSGEEEPQEGESPKQSAGEEPSGEQSPAATPSGEVLMQRVEPEAGAETEAPPAQGEESTALSESAIPPTEAAPLQPAGQLSLGATPTPIATPPAQPEPSSTPSPSPTTTPSPTQTATPSAAPTPSTIRSPQSTPVPSARLSPAAAATPTPAPTPSPAPAAPTLAPTLAPTPVALSTTATPTGSVSATPAPSPGESFQSPSPSPIPSPTPTQLASTPIATSSPSPPSPTPTEAPVAIATPARSPTPIETPQSIPSLRLTPPASGPTPSATQQSAAESSSVVQASPPVTAPSPPLAPSLPATPISTPSS